MGPSGDDDRPPGLTPGVDRARAPDDERPVKRSLTVAGHRTSVALEPAFWGALEALAYRRGQSLPALVAAIDANRGGTGTSLASALRLAALRAAQHEDGPAD